MGERRLGSYDLLRRLGEGGMAQVYLARDIRLGREVAVKVLNRKLAERPGFRERFMREARVAAALDHPNIVPLYDFGEDNDLYLVMPYVRGGSLQDMLPRAPFPIGEVVTYGSQIADALEYAHQRKVVHRDVKPANMLAHADGRLMLSDFGLAKIVSAANTPNAPRNRPDAGTPEYMAPEQVVGSSDARSDIYGLGVVLFLLLTGRLPFSGANAQDVMEAHLRRDPGSPRRYNPAIPPAMEAVVMRALAKRPDDRFQRASDLGAALLSALIAEDDGSSPFVIGWSSHGGSRPTGQMPIIPPGEWTAGPGPQAQQAPDAPLWRQRQPGASASAEERSSSASAGSSNVVGASSTEDGYGTPRSSVRPVSGIASALPDLNMPFTSMDPTHGFPTSQVTASESASGGLPGYGATGASPHGGSWLSGGAFSFADSQAVSESVAGYGPGRRPTDPALTSGPRHPLQETQRGPAMSPGLQGDGSGVRRTPGIAPGATPWGAPPDATPGGFGSPFTGNPTQSRLDLGRAAQAYAQEYDGQAFVAPGPGGHLPAGAGQSERAAGMGAPTSVRLESGTAFGDSQAPAGGQQSRGAPLTQAVTRASYDPSAGDARASLPGIRATEPPEAPLERERDSRMWIIIVALLIVLMVAVIVLLRWLEAGPAGFMLFVG